MKQFLIIVEVREKGASAEDAQERFEEGMRDHYWNAESEPWTVKEVRPAP